MAIPVPPKSANSAQPSGLKAKVPNDAFAAAAQAYAEKTDAPAGNDPFAAAAQAYTQPSSTSADAEQSTFESPWYTKMLPLAGGIVGGIAGAPLGPAGAVGGATLGGAAGQSYRDLIETNLLGKPQSSTTEVAKGIGTAAVEEGASQLLGMGIMKAAGSAVKLASNQIAAPVKQFMADTVKSVRASVEEPLTKLIASKITPLTAEGAGDSAKQLLKQNITNKYGPFIQAYTNLGDVAKVTPIKDEARRKFTMGLKEWGVENHSGDNWKVIKKFSDDIDAANTGAQLDSVIQQIGDARSVAFKSGASRQATVLKELQTRAQDFSEGEITKIATLIQAGKASPQEMQFIQQLAQQRGIAGPDATKYAKTIAKDYLTAKDKVRTDYAGFRSFLEDVSEQAKVKVNNKGPMTFLSDLENVPSEKLIERMFDPKNAAAFRRMQTETPEVFDVVAKSRVSRLVQESSPDGTLNLEKLRTNIYKLPEDTRKLLFTSDNMATLNKVVSNPKLKRLDSVERLGDNALIKWVNDLTDVTLTVGEGVAKAPRTSAGIRQVIGGAGVGAGKVVAPQIRDMLAKEPQE
jgi:hypothetical protein